MASPVKVVKFHLFNCDKTYKLDSVETLLVKVANNLNIKILVDKRNFRLHEMQDVCERTIPMLQMDYAVFVVHANESRLSINEDNAGIGYAKIYRTLLQATGNKVLIVIGSDKEYQDENEEDRVVISRWARRKVETQFKAEYLDGRKSFIFSWNKGHREIHEKALEHYLDPCKKGLKFQYVPKQEPAIAILEPSSSTNFFPPVSDSADEDDIYDDKEPLLATQKRQTGQEEGKGGSSILLQESTSEGLRPVPIDSRPEFLEGTVLLDTVMRFGRISYKDEDVKVWDHRWKPSETIVRRMSNDWMFRPLAKISFVAQANGGVSYSVLPQSICVWLRAILLTCMITLKPPI
ncbi:uncharacterized protein LOC111341860 isoform X2 [Stylophora pistillata]|uniref:uncharacterized protein LOC111341860 isoform X2 n=1 Tax=Stylophora pistillata TaxID=50429 RepID=UPI000C03A29C|nr:uncharacterized protein LOC111341860 isoform X2 [Stylophora pistillata]